MIVDDLNQRLTVAMAANSQAADIGLVWNIALGAPPMPDGRRAILVQLILSCASPVLGQRFWHVLDLPVDAFAGSDEVLRKFAFDIVQQMLAVRAQALQISEASS